MFYFSLFLAFLSGSLANSAYGDEPRKEPPCTEATLSHIGAHASKFVFPFHSEKPPRLGLSVDFDKDRKRLKIDKVSAGPAMLLGLGSGDEIVAVGVDPAAPSDTSEIAKRLDAGQPFNIWIAKNGCEPANGYRHIRIEIARDTSEVKSVSESESKSSGPSGNSSFPIVEAVFGPTYDPNFEVFSFYDGNFDQEKNKWIGGYRTIWYDAYTGEPAEGQEEAARLISHFETSYDGRYYRDKRGVVNIKTGQWIRHKLTPWKLEEKK
jgi:hypothetical protein